MTYIIAEIGSNWRTFEDCAFSIGACKRAGAQAVKFQMFTHKELYGYDEKMRFELKREWIPALAAEAKTWGIDFLCTAFSPDGVEFLDPFVRFHKVASSEISHIGILNAIARCGKKAIISTGSAHIAEMQRALEILPSATLLYCCPEYPAKHVDLRWLDAMWEMFRVPIGYSDHTDHVLGVALEALRRKVPIFEKHVTCFPEQKTPDAKHSITDLELKQLINAVENGQPDWGAWMRRDMVCRHKRRAVATTDLVLGDELVEGKNWGLYRAKEERAYVSPAAWMPKAGKVDELGSMVGRNMKQGETILPEDCLHHG